LLAVQSSVIGTVVVKASPAVTAPSLKSVASTKPSRPTFGVNSQM
jgi:hypothetical protein